MAKCRGESGNVTTSKGLTKEILTVLGAGALVATAVFMPGAGYALKEIQREQFRQERMKRRLASTIRRLEKQEVVSWREKGDELELTLTDKGRKKVLHYNVDDLRLKEQTHWDGMFRVVIFDIPETKKVAREIFRKKLRQLGFEKLQKSVFMTRLQCKNEIDFLRHNLEIAPYVTYILAKDIVHVSKEN